MTEFRWYQTFLAIYKAGTLTSAAESLGMTQPGVSQQLLALETHVGHKLFERLPRQVVPTEYGKLLHSQIAEPLDRLAQATEIFTRQARRVHPLIQLGTPHEFFTEVVTAVLPTIPYCLSVQFGQAGDLLETLKKGEVDAIISTAEPSGSDMNYEPIFNETMVLVASTHVDANPFRAAVAANDTVQMEKWLSAQPWMAYSHNLQLNRQFWQLNFGHRPSFKPHYTIPDLRTQLKSMHYIPAVALIPDYLCVSALKEGHVVSLWPENVLAKNTLYWAVNKRSPYQSELRELYVAILQQLSSR